MGPEGLAPALPGQRRMKASPARGNSLVWPWKCGHCGGWGTGEEASLGPALASQAVSVPTGGRGAGGGSWQGGAAGAQHDCTEGGAAWAEAQAPPGECHGIPWAHTHTRAHTCAGTHALNSKHVCPAGTWDHWGWAVGCSPPAAPLLPCPWTPVTSQLSCSLP